MLNIGVYEVGQIPSRPLVVALKDENGQPLNLMPYSDIRFRMLGTDNEVVDLGEDNVQVQDRIFGKVALYFPTDRSVFTRTGDYVFDIELRGSQSRDYTTSATIRVTRLGGTR